MISTRSSKGSGGHPQKPHPIQKNEEIELCGSWLWIGGNTRANKDELKSAGCKWSKSKAKWYWHHAEAGARWYRGKSSMAEIRSKYGSTAFRSRGAQDLETVTA